VMETQHVILFFILLSNITLSLSWMLLPSRSLYLFVHHSNYKSFRKYKINSAQCTTTTLFHSSSNIFPKIVSTKNRTAKLFQNLILKKKAREENQLTVIEGRRAVMDILVKNEELISHILVTDEALEQNGSKLLDLLSTYQNKNKNGINLVSKEVLKSCSDTVTPQGIVATIRIPSLSPKNTRFFLILDGLSDPGNVGTLLRTSAAIGFVSVILLHNNVDVYSPKVIRSSMGAIFQIPIFKCQTFDQCQQLLKKTNVPTIYAATMCQDNIQSKPFWDIDWCTSSKVALCIGSEATGLSLEVRHEIETRKIQAVHIPMIPHSTESLNASVCGSIIMYEYFRQNIE